MVVIPRNNLLQTHLFMVWNRNILQSKGACGSLEDEKKSVLEIKS